MRKYKIYHLIDPRTNEIRYVGQTVQTLENRLKKHLRSKDKSHRVNWIKSITNEGLEPIIELICETNTLDKCNELEQFYIKKYRDEGLKLTNMTDGGDGSIGFTHSEESKKKMRKVANKRMSNPDVINNLKEKGLEQWENYSEEYKLQNKLNQKGRRNILQYDMDNNLIREFISLREIERELGFFRANITPCLKGEFKQAYGYIWKYKN